MDIATILKSAAELGVTGVIAIILLLAYREMTAKMTDVVANNTQALTRLCDSTQQTVDTLEQHDERAQRIEQTVGQVSRVVDRTEQTVNAMHRTINGKNKDA